MVEGAFHPVQLDEYRAGLMLESPRILEDRVWDFIGGLRHLDLSFTNPLLKVCYGTARLSTHDTHPSPQKFTQGVHMTNLYLPGARWMPVTYRADAGKFTTPPLGYIPHVPVSNGSLFNFFNRLVSPNRKFSTAWVAKGGHSEQYQSLDMKPWAQAAGNGQYHAFEVEGYPNEPYTAAQIDTLARWHNFLGTPDTLANAPGQRGIGTHYMGGAAWGGHTCPDPVAGAGPRSRQRPQIIARARLLRGNHPTPPPAPKPTPVPATLDPFQEDPMDRLIIALYRKLLGRTPADVEVDGWLVATAKSGWTGKQLADVFATTGEAKAYAKAHPAGK